MRETNILQMNTLLNENSTALNTEYVDSAVVFVIDTANSDVPLSLFPESARIDDFCVRLKNLTSVIVAEIYKTVDNAVFVLLKAIGRSDIPASIVKVLSLAKHFNYRCSTAYGEIYLEEVDGLAEYVSGAIRRAWRMAEIARYLSTDIIVDSAINNFCGNIEGFSFYRLPHSGPDDISLEKEDIYLGLQTPHSLAQWDRCIELYQRGEDIKSALAEFKLFHKESNEPVLQAVSDCYIGAILGCIKEKESAFTEPQEYMNHSATQKEQGEILLYLIGRASRVKKTVRRILDVGVGTGNLVASLSEQYENAEIVGIDSSKKMCSYMSHHYNSNRRFSFKKVSIDDTSVVKLGSFDIIASNATMHWIKDQTQAYRNMHAMLNENGIIAVHQGAEGCYKELYELAAQVLLDNGFNVPDKKFLTYHTIESIQFIEPLGFEIVDSRIITEPSPATLVDDFSHAGMLPYLRGLSEDDKIKVREHFKTAAKDIPSITIRRLYFVARKTDH